MSTEELLSELRRRGIRVWAEDGRLRYEAPAGALDEPLRAAVKERRADLLERLAEGEAAVAGATESHERIHPIPRDGRELPLSFGQQRLWFLHQLAPENLAYNVPSTVRLRGALDVSALTRALGEIVARHETLRSRFPAVDGQATLVIDPPGAAGIEVESFESLPEDARLEAARREALADATRPFDLGAGPLFRVRLFRLGPTDHVLHAVMHHIISDGWSMLVFFRELAALYAAFLRGEPSPLAPLPIQYADHAWWQRESLARRGLESQLAWWKEQFAGELPVLDLPRDRPRPAQPGHRGAFVWLPVSDELRDGLARLSQREGVTRFQTMLAAFSVLLARHGGQEDLVVGTPIAARGRREIEGLIGFFVDNLVLRCDLSGDPTFRELLPRVRRVVLDAFAHQDVPFERLVDALKPERELGRNPLFQVLFNHFDLSETEFGLPPLELTSLDVSLEVSKFDLTLHAFEVEGRLIVKLEYDTDLFDRETIEALGGRYLTLLRGVVAEPGARISRLPLLTAEERARLLAQGNRGEARPPESGSIHALFQEQARRTPDAPALVCEDRRLTYAELEAAASALARRLLAAGVGPESRVALLVDRSAEMIVALLGVLEAGGAYVPIDAATPAERVAFLLEDAGCRVLLTRRALRASVPEQAARVLCVDDDEPAPEGDLPAARPGQLAYVIYTSGSTGRPKGVEVEHAQVLSYLSAIVPRLEVPPDSSFATVSTLAADLGHTSIFPALCGGGCLHVLSDERIGDGAAFADWFARHRIDVLKIVPSHLEALLSAAPRPAEVLPRRLLVLGGEACSWELVERVRALAPELAVMNHYGPAETTIGALTHRIEPGDRQRFPLRPPLGRPLANAQVYLVDQHLEPVPLGAAGEVLIAGGGVTRGYLGRPELTAERFIAHPFRRGAGGRAYRTGDLARSTRDGRLIFLGRADDQVKVRGFRVEPGEVRAALERHPDVSAAAVVARRDPLGVQRLVAYVVPRAGAAPDPSELRAFLKTRLPESMVPAACMTLPALPLTRNGKLDRQALPSPDFDRDVLRGDFVAPRTPAEETLARIWCDVLRLQRVGVHDNFFELGGESILSIQIISRANRAGLRLKPKDVFERATIAELAAVAGGESRPGAEQGAVTGAVPLTPIQRRFLDPEPARPAHYNHALLLLVRRPVEAAVLEAALAALHEHHDALRLRLARGAGGWSQELAAPGGGPPFELVDLAGAAPEERGRAIESRARAEQEGLDLARGPLWRAVLFRCGGDEPDRLLLVVHHLAVDGVSWRLLLEDLALACEQLAARRPVRLPPKTSSFQSWAEVLVARAGAADTLSRAAAWVARLGRAPARLPVDRPAPAGSNTAAAAATLDVALDEQETAALLREAPRAWRTQVNELLLTALALGVRTWTGSPRLLVDLEGHGRDDVPAGLDVARTVGWFTAVAPVLLDLGEVAGPGEALVAVKEGLRAQKHPAQEWGLLRLLSPAGAAVDALRALPPAEIGFNYMGHFEQSLREGGLFERAPESTGASTSPDNARRYLLDVGGAVADGRLRLSFTWCTALHERASIEALGASVLAALRALIAACTAPGAGGRTPSDFPLAHLDRAALARIEARFGPDLIEDVYALSPLQRGMVFHTLAEPGSGAYVTQLALTLHGELAADRLRAAWQRALDRNPVLRTAFVADERGELHQVVCRGVALRWHEDDWSALPAEEQVSRLAEQGRRDRRAGFELDDPPLMRLRLIRQGPARHRLLWTHHHVLLDGWSLPLLVRDVLEAYAPQGAADGAPRRPYVEYIRWLAAQDAERAARHWRALLGDWSEPTPLPAGTGAADAGPGGRAIQAHALGEEATAALVALARRQHVTLNTLVQGAWALLLARHSRREEVLFGVTISGRPPDLPGVETMLGLFINTLPLRVDTADAPLSEWLARLQQQLVELQQFEASPLYEVQRAAALAPGAPLFESLVVFENYPVEVREPVAAAGLSIEDAVDVSHANYPLALVAQPGRQLALQLRYDTGRYDAPAIRRLLLQLERLLEGLASERATRLAELSPLSEDERRRQLETWNDTTRPYPRQATVPQLFEEQVARAPGSPAVVAGGVTLTYAELDRRANRLAWELRRRGVAPGSLVAIQLERGPDLVAGLLGILKAGCAYVPLDPEHPPRRIDVLLQDSGASALIARGAPAGGRAGFAGPVIDVEAVPAAPAGEDDRAGPPRTLAAGDLAYVIYTSGSTGQPKGVCIPHRGITRLVLGTDFVQLQPADRVACASNVAFDAATFEIWGALLNGACSVCIDKDTALSPERFAAVLREQRVTTLFVTTALFNQLVQAVPDVFATLKHLLFGGEAVDPRRVRAVLERGRPARLLHVYGPTECTTYSTWHEVLEVPQGATTVPIGRPIANSTAYVLDPGLGPTPVGAPGELFLGGDGLALGYHRRPALTAERFVPHPFRPGERLYRTGDLVRQRADGALEFVGRTDTQVKLRGFRIEPGEVEESLRRQAGVAEVIVLCREDSPGERELVAYVVAAPGASVGRDALRAALAAELPEPMVPAAIVILPELPLTPNGKVDRRALPAPTGRRVDRAFAPPTGATEERIAAIWRDVLGVSLVGSRDNFFDLGGHSLKLLAVHRRLAAELGARLAVTELFQHTTVEALARRIDGDRAEGEPAAPAAGIAPRAAPSRRPADGERSIAIVGMAGRFPGASDVEAFWRNLCDGVESITTFGAEELRRAGVPDELIGDSRYVPRRAVLDEPDRFDARFFGYTPREAELMDPQQRLFLECAWEALERAGYDPARHERPVGVFAGASVNSYLDVLRTRPELLAAAGGMAALIASISDFLTTRVSYKLNLHGPSMNVQTACSTSLVAVHEACRSLLDGGCDLALAGGVSVTVPWVSGYLHEASGVRSPDGHCRTFDARAEGMVSGNGVALVVLKRLADAVTDGDTIHAVIRGTAINNDGARKIGFTAPSIDGQAEVVARAQEQAGVEPGSIGFVECHGTATALGDPIEVAALTRVFRRGTAATGFCALASLKSNMGHLDAAAGVAGLIKAALAVERGVIPPSLHYVAPNPEIDFARSPFFVAARRLEWTPADGAPRRAGVSAFGIGGTNAHAVLEQPPAPAASGPSRPWQLLQLSARSEAALEAAGERLARHLEREPGLDLADVAHTLRVGRHDFEHRRAVLCADAAGALAALRGELPERRWTRRAPDGERPVAFLFPGQGAQYAGMAHGLYGSEPIFREALDRCLAILRETLALDLRPALFPGDADRAGADARLTATSLAQPALFCVEYALAQLWQSWGVQPAATVGHSVGEFVSACLAGVMRLPDALRLVTLRGRLMEAMPRGVMLAVPLAEAALLERLAGRPGLWLCGVNAPEMCVVGGTEAAVADLEQQLAGERTAATRLHTSHAFHSGLMDGAVAPFVEEASKVQLSAPTSPYVSTLTGDWITSEQATDPRFWGRQIREPVRYSAAVARLLEHPGRALLEVGPGTALGSLARAQPACGPDRVIVASLRQARASDDDQAVLLGALGRLWTSGVTFDARRFSAGERRRRVVLPTYPFERLRYWVERRDHPQAAARRALDDWFYAPVWRMTGAPAPAPIAATSQPAFDCLLFGDGDALERRVVAGLRRAGRTVLVARPGTAYGLEGEQATLDPASSGHARQLVDACLAAGGMPGLVVHLWLAGGGADGRAEAQRGYFHLARLARVLAEAEVATPVRIAVVTSGVASVTGREVVHPAQALTLGICRVLPLEQPGLSCRLIDIDADADAELVDELLSAGDEAIVAWRAGRRWAESFAPLPLPAPAGPPPVLRPGGTYLVTGGLGGMGLALARALHQACGARLVLVGRTPLPERERWDEWLASHPPGDAASRRIRGVRALEQAGARVLVLCGDVADRGQLAAVVEAAERRCGPIHGVIHAAGVPPAGLLQRLDDERSAAVLAPKVEGTRLLLERLGGRVDFVVLCSSLNAIKGFPGAAAYSAANAHLDACARAAESATGARVVSIGWSRWRESGMAVDAAGGPLPADQGLSDAEGAEVLLRVLAGRPGAHVLVSERDLREVLASAPDRELARSEAAGAIGAIGADGATDASSGRHPRPALATELVAPATPLEAELAAIWEQHFGLAPIGTRDDFFELGGHSLLAMRVVNRVLQLHPGIKLTLRALFDAPTVAGLAAHVASLLQAAPAAPPPAAVPTARTAAAPAAPDPRPEDVAHLSDDEVAALLARLDGEERRGP